MTGQWPARLVIRAREQGSGELADLMRSYGLDPHAVKLPRGGARRRLSKPERDLLHFRRGEDSSIREAARWAEDLQELRVLAMRDAVNLSISEPTRPELVGPYRELMADLGRDIDGLVVSPDVKDPVLWRNRVAVRTPKAKTPMADGKWETVKRRIAQYVVIPPTHKAASSDVAFFIENGC